MTKVLKGLALLLALALAPAAWAGDTKISALPAASAGSDTDVYPTTQGTCPSSCATNGITGAQLKAYATGQTAHGVLIGAGASTAMGATAAMTNGQLLVGQTGADPLPKTVSGDATMAASGALTVTKTNGASFATVATSGAATDLTGTLGLGHGGTGQTTAAAARGSSGLNIDAVTLHGDSIYTILATDRVVATSAALTASRTWTLPAASAMNPGQILRVTDQFGGVSGSNTLVIARAGSDTINGAATSITISATYGTVDLISDGVSAWTVVGSSRPKTAPTHQFSTGSSVATGPSFAQPAFTDISGTASAAQLPLPGAASLGGVFSKATASHNYLTGISSVDGSVSAAQPACSDLTGAAASCGTNATELSSGTVAAARGGAGTISGALKGNGSGTVSQAACADLSNAAASCSTDATNATNIASGTLAAARGGAGTISGALKGNGSGVVSQAAASDLSDTVARTTFTPTITFATPGDLSVAYATQTGAYAKVGPLTCVWYNLVFTPTFTTASSVFQVSAPPVTPTDTGDWALNVRNFSPLTWVSSGTQLVTNWNGSIWQLQAEKSGSAPSNFLAGQFTSGVQYTLNFSGCYF